MQRSRAFSAYYCGPVVRYAPGNVLVVMWWLTIRTSNDAAPFCVWFLTGGSRHEQLLFFLNVREGIEIAYGF